MADRPEAGSVLPETRPGYVGRLEIDRTLLVTRVTGPGQAAVEQGRGDSRVARIRSGVRAGDGHNGVVGDGQDRVLGGFEAQVCDRFSFPEGQPQGFRSILQPANPVFAPFVDDERDEDRGGGQVATQVDLQEFDEVQVIGRGPADLDVFGAVPHGLQAAQGIHHEQAEAQGEPGVDGGLLVDEQGDGVLKAAVRQPVGSERGVQGPVDAPGVLRNGSVGEVGDVRGAYIPEFVRKGQQEPGQPAGAHGGYSQAGAQGLFQTRSEDSGIGIAGRPGRLPVRCVAVGGQARRLVQVGFGKGNDLQRQDDLSLRGLSDDFPASVRQGPVNRVCAASAGPMGTAGRTHGFGAEWTAIARASTSPGRFPRIQVVGAVRADHASGCLVREGDRAAQNQGAVLVFLADQFGFPSTRRFGIRVCTAIRFSVALTSRHGRPFEPGGVQ